MGGFSPLKGFCTEAEYKSVVNDMQLPVRSRYCRTVFPSIAPCCLLLSLSLSLARFLLSLAVVWGRERARGAAFSPAPTGARATLHFDRPSTEPVDFVQWHLQSLVRRLGSHALPWAADSCPWVGKLRTVLPFYEP